MVNFKQLLGKGTCMCISDVLIYWLFLLLTRESHQFWP